jgi:Mrp family chromosome partitioning ATPase
MHSGHTAGPMRLGDYVGLLRRQWLTVLLCLLLGVGAALAYVQWAPKEYRSQTSVLVTPTTADAATERSAEINLDTEAQLVTSTETVADAGALLAEEGVTLDDLPGRLNVSVPPNTEILDITFIGDTAEQAQLGARAFAQAYLDQRQDTAEAALQAEYDALQTRYDAVKALLDEAVRAGQSLAADSTEAARNERQVQALNDQLANIISSQNRIQAESPSPGRVVTEAPLPRSPSSPDLFIALGAGILLGLVAGIGVAALRHRADDVVRTPEDLYRRTGVPVTSVLSTRLHDGEVTILQPLSADGRGYARLRNLVTTSLEESNRRVVLVAGVRRGGGPVAANLAASLARAGEDVVLVCADVFGDTAAALLPGAAPSAGLAEVLAGEQPVESVLRRLPGIQGLRILTPGLDVDRADALLQTRSPRKLVDRLLESASYVVVEASATTDSPDAQTLANVAELAVLVVESGATRSREVVDACAQLESMGTPVLGAVVARFGRDSDVDLRTLPAEEDEEDEDTGDESSDESATASGDADAPTEDDEPATPHAATTVDRPAGQPSVPVSQPVGATSSANGGPTGLPPRPSDTQVIAPASRGPAPR